METNNLPSTDIHLSTASDIKDQILQEGGFYRGKLLLVCSYNPVAWPLFMDTTSKRSIWSDVMTGLHCQMAAGDKGTPWEPELPSWNKVCGGKEKPQNAILDDKYKKGKRSRSGKQRRTSW